MAQHIRALKMAAAIVLISSNLASAATPDAFRHFSRAHFLAIGNKICTNQKKFTPQCCRFNGGLWHDIPKPGHCLFL